MTIKRRKLYEKNRLGYTLVLFYILINVAYSIFTIKNMEKNYEVGIFIMTTIVLLLVGFLTAVKVQNYSMLWSCVAIILGLFQFSRLLFMPALESETLPVVLSVFLIISGILCFAGGVVSIRNTQIRKNCVKEYNRNNEHSIK